VGISRAGSQSIETTSWVGRAQSWPTQFDPQFHLGPAEGTPQRQPRRPGVRSALHLHRHDRVRSRRSRLSTAGQLASL